MPFIIRWPGKTEPGKVSDALISQIDLMATIAAALEVDLPEKNCAEDSFNQLPVLEHQVTASPIRNSHIHNTRANQYAIREGDWLLIDAPNGYVSGRNKAWESKREYPADDGGPVELYNLESDPGQKKNLASQHPDKVKDMQELLKKIREQGHSAPRLSKKGA